MWYLSAYAGICVGERLCSMEKLWIKSRSGNPTIRTAPYKEDGIEYLGEYDGWFRVFRLSCDVIAISEPYHAQGVFSFLIFGTEKSVLLDTGQGMGDIRPLVDKFLPEDSTLMVVNTHTHFDHVGDNYHFEKVWIYDDPVAINCAEHGISNELLKPELKESCFYGKMPEQFEPAYYFIHPFSYDLLEDGDVIDLGNRKLQVIHTPGHSEDGIMLYDEKYKLLFTGDTYYPGRLYLLNSWDQIDIYIQTFQKLEDMNLDVELLIPSHNFPQDDPHILSVVMAALKTLKRGDGPVGRYMEDFGDWVRGYDFDGCTIVLPSN